MHTVKWKGFITTGNASLAIRLEPKNTAKECSFSPLKNGTEVGVAYETNDWYLIKYDGKFGYVNKKYINKTKPENNTTSKTDDIHTVKWNGIVKTGGDSLNVRVQPSTNAKTCSFSPLKNGAAVGVCHQTGKWYLIKYNNKFGYVYSDYIVRK